MLESYLPIGIFFIMSLFIAMILLSVPFLLSKKSKQGQYKFDNYESGNKPFQQPRMRMNFKFYLVAILFIIFDIEICFLVPWIVEQHNVGITGFISMMVFFLILSIGFLYEMKKGVIDCK